MTNQTLQNRVQEETLGMNDSLENTIRQDSNYSLESLDKIIEEANKRKYQMYQENPSLANKQAFYNSMKNIAKSVYYGVSGFLCIPTAFRRDGYIRYLTKCLGYQFMDKYDFDYNERKASKVLNESKRLDESLFSFTNAAGAYIGIAYNTIGTAVAGVCYLCGVIEGSTLGKLTIPLAATAVSGGYELARALFYSERNKIIEASKPKTNSKEEY